LPFACSFKKPKITKSKTHNNKYKFFLSWPIAKGEEPRAEFTEKRKISLNSLLDKLI
jgi:hypothetical protein